MCLLIISICAPSASSGERASKEDGIEERRCDATISGLGSHSIVTPHLRPRMHLTSFLHSPHARFSALIRENATGRNRPGERKTTNYVTIDLSNTRFISTFFSLFVMCARVRLSRS